MKLTPARDPDTGAVFRAPRFETDGATRAIAFLLDDDVEELLDAYFDGETPVFDLFVETITGAGAHVVPMLLAIPGMGEEGILSPRKDPALRDVAGGDDFLDLPIRKRETGQESIWGLTAKQFAGWKQSREIEVIFMGETGFPTVMRITTPPLIESVASLTEKGVEAFRNEFAFLPEVTSNPAVLKSIRSLWASGIITGLQISCENSALQSEILFRENLVTLSQKD